MNEDLGVTPITRADVERVLAQVETYSLEAANLLRNYITRIERQLETYQLGDDDLEPE